RLVDVAAAEDGNVVGQELQRDDRDDRLEKILDVGDLDDVVGQRGHARVAFADDGDDRPTAGFDFFQVRHDLFVDLAVRNDEDAGSVLVHQRDRTVFHFGGRIAFGVDV